MNSKKAKIGNKILYIVIPAILILAIAMGTVSVYVVTKLSKENSEKIMVEICENKVLQINHELNMVSHSVEMIYEYSKELAEYDKTDFDIYSEEYETRIRELAITVANKTDGAMAVYFRYNPEKTGDGTSGFFWSRSKDTDVFSEEKPTDILAYYEEDMEHVGWFYVPKKTGEPLWMKPYLNQNLNVFMISYVMPVYLNSGEFVGVLGMDIDFNTILSATENVHLYETGSIVLVDVGERLVYRNGEDGNAVINRLSNSLYNHITTINKKNEVLTAYDERGNAIAICYKKLNNDMVMCTVVPFAEINSRRNSLALICIILSALVFAGTTYVILRRIKKIIDPLKKITEVTKQYAEGEWSENYICVTNDEIEDLSTSVAIMAQNTQKYIEEIHSWARQDAMTGINNKTYYLEKVDEIKNSSEYLEYAVSVMDLNLLKKTNDIYGHEAGDILIKEAAQYISRIFSKSDVFRIGGDEFVVISFREDYENREALLQEFEKGMYYKVKEIGDLELAVSFGMASNPEDARDYDSVFNLADKRMYEKKKEMKLGRTD